MNTSYATPLSPILAHYAAPPQYRYQGPPLYRPTGVLTADEQAAANQRLQEATENAQLILLGWTVVSLASAGICAYHGSKRNHGELLPALGWGLLGGFFPVVAPVVALAQGYAEPAKK